MQNEEMRAKKPFLRPLIYLKISDGLNKAFITPETLRKPMIKICSKNLPWICRKFLQVYNMQSHQKNIYIITIIFQSWTI